MTKLISVWLKNISHKGLELFFRDFCVFGGLVSDFKIKKRQLVGCRFKMELKSNN